MSFLCAIGMDAPVNLFVTSSPQKETLWQPDTNRQWHECSRELFGYQVKVQWKCEFDDCGITTPELLANPTVRQSLLCTRDALYGGPILAMRLHYKAGDGENIQYVDVIILSPYIC
jgi:hypothetical protein